MDRGKAHIDELDQAALDAGDLAALGHAETLTRKFDVWSMLALSFCILGTWSTCAQNLASGLLNGGPVTILWGLVFVFGCNLCVAISLGELCSSMPTALGQAFWISRLWETPWGRRSSYMCAWINTFGWWTLTASQNAFMTQFLLGMKLMFDPEWEGANKGWVKLLVYVGITVAFSAFNHVACRNEKILPGFNNFVAVGFVALFFALAIGLPIAVGTHHELHFQNAKFVFGTWINSTGWNSGVTWFLGLVQSAYGLTAFDSVIHMVEEIPNPRKQTPMTMYMSVICGAVSGWIFLCACLFCVQDFKNLQEPTSGQPFIQLIQDVVGVKGAAVFVALFIFNGMGQGISIMTSASRLTWSFARDGGIPFARYFAHVDTYWLMPVRALWLQAGITAVVGLLYLFADTVLQAILSVSTIALTISYAMPIAALMLAGRERLPPGGTLHLGRWGPLLNWISLVYCTVSTVFFFFPSAPNPGIADMNWAIAVFGIMLVVSVSFWFLQGQRTYMEPQYLPENILVDDPAVSETYGTFADDSLESSFAGPSSAS
ncbi:amino acid permease family [Cordyceps militaris]|uniref:Amino acid permease family n=1 Tax=Cordyceps militaris TaxID=73501 RepID=A0A2H4SP40_CORMI|nr:amino acid permease family [Cordyceps militaris]